MAAHQNNFQICIDGIGGVMTKTSDSNTNFGVLFFSMTFLSRQG